MDQHASSLLTKHLEVSTRQALNKELEKGERSGFVMNFNRDDLLKELHSKWRSSGSVRTQTFVENRKANFSGE
jgi:hypothetical protein